MKKSHYKLAVRTINAAKKWGQRPESNIPGAPYGDQVAAAIGLLNRMRTNGRNESKMLRNAGGWRSKNERPGKYQ